MALTLIIYGFTIILSLFNIRFIRNSDLESDKKFNGYYIFFTCLMFVLLAGCREGFVDTETYKKMSDTIGTDFMNAFNGTLPTEIGFNILMILCNKIINNSQFFIFVSTAIIFILLFYKIYKSSIDKSFSVMLFFLLYFFTYINGIRQAIVATIIFCIFDKIKDNNIRLIVICCCLSLIHLSALFLIPLIICTRGNIFNYKIKLLYFMAFFSLFLPNFFNNILSVFLTDRYIDTLSQATNGINLFRLLVYSVPLILALVYAKRKGTGKLRIEEKRMINLLFVDFCVYIFSISSVYFARIGIYLSLFSILYIPYLLEKLFSFKNYIFIKYGSIILYSLYFFYQVYTFYSYGYLKDFYLFFLK